MKWTSERLLSLLLYGAVDQDESNSYIKHISQTLQTKLDDEPDVLRTSMSTVIAKLSNMAFDLSRKGVVDCIDLQKFVHYVNIHSENLPNELSNIMNGEQERWIELTGDREFVEYILNQEDAVKVTVTPPPSRRPSTQQESPWSMVNTPTSDQGSSE